MSHAIWQLESVDVTYRSWLRPPHRALASASLQLTAGERLGIVGPSGGGKSSLVKAGLGLLLPSAGTVRWFGADTRTWGRTEWHQLRSRVQWLPQGSGALLHPRMRIRDQLLRSAQHHGRSPHVVDDLLAKLGLSTRRLALPHELSGGERRRAAVARVLLPEPLVLIADEPTSGLDAERCHEVLQQVLTCPPEGARVVVGHDLPALARHCDRLLVVVEGRIVADVDSAELREGRYQPEGDAFAELLEASGYRTAP